jgi:hypothetical protein
MSYQVCTFTDLSAFLKCLQFEAVEILDDAAEQIKFVHPFRKDQYSRRNWIIVPNYPVLAGKVLQRILKLIVDYEFPSSEIEKCSKKHIQI